MSGWGASGQPRLDLGKAKQKKRAQPEQSWITGVREIRTGFDGNQVRLFQLFARYGIRAILGDVFLHETTVIDMSRLCRNDRILRGLTGDGTKEHDGGRVSRGRVFLCLRLKSQTGVNTSTISTAGLISWGLEGRKCLRNSSVSFCPS
jgi:hypothetical protein